MEHPQYDEQTLKAYLARLSTQAIPKQALARIKVLARDLAEGATEGLWLPSFFVTDFDKDDLNFKYYFEKRWGGRKKAPDIGLLRSAGYLDYMKGLFRVNPKAFDLLNETPDVNIFISYARKESSAFALLVHNKLKTAGMNAFIDMALEPGENWSEGLVKRVGECEYFVVVLGKQTLLSPYVVGEMLWAHQAGLRIIPIWHNGFVYPSEKFDLPEELDELLQTTHTVRVLEESALGYNTALVELLNWFGITPD